LRCRSRNGRIFSCARCQAFPHAKTITHSNTGADVNTGADADFDGYSCDLSHPDHRTQPHRYGRGHFVALPVTDRLRSDGQFAGETSEE
jgi:hypothetical protein